MNYLSKTKCLLATILMVLPASLNATETAVPQDQSALYAEACRAQIGEIPEFSCADGVEVPITVDGKTVAPVKDMTCDRPGLLPNGTGSDGQCVPYSRILSLSNDKTQIAVMCRQKKIRSADSMDFDELDIVAHNPQTGATCWFHATGDDEQPVSGAKVPSPMSDSGLTFWKTPEETFAAGCGACHDNDPFMFSPFVGQVWSHMPTNPFGPYYHVDLAPPNAIGFKEWPTQALNPRDNTCLGCHRIGIQETCGLLTEEMTGRATPKGADIWAQHFPGSHAMPPDLDVTEKSWDTIYSASVDQIQSCCERPDPPACQIRQIEQFLEGK